jgi:hypothetical protein
MLWVLEPESVSNGVELDAALRVGLMRMKNSDHPIMIATSQMLLLAKGIYRQKSRSLDFFACSKLDFDSSIEQS